MPLVLTESRRLRFGSFCAFYAAQGVPIGLLSVAIPAWLGEQGASTGQVATFVLWVGLPWALKLIAGPFMDRFTFLPMGFRRPWALAMQSGLVLALLALAVVGMGFEDGLEGGSLAALTAAGAIVNAFAATQDVAVDGMAIDVLPADERGRANAFMGFGQTAAFAAFGYLCGILLGRAGIAAGALACAIAVAAILCWGVALRERAGERRAPWSRGEAAPRPGPRPTMFGNMGSVMRVLVLPMSLLAIAVEFVARLRDGIALALFPVLATQELGFNTEQFTRIHGISAFAAAALVICFGPAIDRFGARRVLFLALLGSAATHVAAGIVPGLWHDATGAIALYCLSVMLTQLVFVSVIALFMNLCWSGVAATQFAVYMALANLGRSAGAGLLAMLEERLGHAELLVLMAGLLAAAAVLLLFLREDKHQRQLAAWADGRAETPAGAAAIRRRPSPGR